ncbi:piggyBac transposable element-derived protein 4-like [Suncus etruscus]|uniref:piggyBac transposable element-derived protein 4-like n=1 Tax=Suncus etruscus TaxID=109475 RepID=UPI00210FFC7B|nr:piggyBac transposable element-derived protein 4-like [Suncus etruscus]
MLKPVLECTNLISSDDEEPITSHSDNIDNIDMEIDDSSNESINASREKKLRPVILSSSSDKNLVDGKEVEPLDNESYEYITEEECLDSESGDDYDEEWQQVGGSGTVVHESSRKEKFLIENIDKNDPFSLYKLFLTNDILQMIIEETNKYAVQCENNSTSNSRRQQQSWKPVTMGEMNTFIGILLIMGVIQVPEIRLYWSTKEMYMNTRIKNAMKCERFLAILKYLHFSDNTTARTEDRLDKIRSIVEAIVATFKNAVEPGENIVIYKSIIPWKGLFGFRQYIPGKTHKYGIKLYKLCLPGGYTYNLDIYSGNDATIMEKTHANDVVMKLMSGLLFEERIVFTDSYYTSVPLAEELLQKKTYICGTVKINKNFLPREAKQKQKQGDIMSFENHTGVRFLKWTDKRPISMLTTSKNHMCTIIEGKNGTLKPGAVFYYNIAKKGVDISDQMASYYNCLQKTIKWYRKIVIQLICGTLLVNAWYIHKRWGNKQINILKFRERIIDQLLISSHHTEEMAPGEKIPRKEVIHFLDSYTESARTSRKRCRGCYKSLSEREGRNVALKKAKRVKTFCRLCEGQPALCLECFKKLHENK